MNTVAIDPTGTLTVYVGTQFHPSVRIMFAATYGRGAFEMFTPASKAPKQ